MSWACLPFWVLILEGNHRRALACGAFERDIKHHEFRDDYYY